MTDHGQEELIHLNPQSVKFKRDQGDMLTVVIDQETYSEVALYDTFPLTYPKQYISLRTKDGSELGILSNLNELDQKSRHEAERELHLRYLIPTITQVISVKEEGGRWQLKFKTDRGELELLLRNIHDSIKMNESGSLTFKDHEDREVRIPDIRKLDSKSMRQLNKVL